MSLRDTLSMYWPTIQGNLFPWLEEELGPLTEKQQQLERLSLLTWWMWRELWGHNTLLPGKFRTVSPKFSM